VERLAIFAVPLYKFKFDKHEEFKAQVMGYISDSESYKDTSSPGAVLKYTSPNLHKLELFKPITEFFQTCLEQVMDDMGYKPNIQITSLWGTEHQDGGSHHRHVHQNAFLGGVYYLDGWVRSSGTIFYSPYGFNQITPAVSGKPFRIQHNHITQFEEGTLYLFPAWLQHSTNVNRIETTKSIRHIIGCNAMPLGPTNHDEWDRFDYQSIENRELISKRSDRFK
jgi:hypothetical protein